MAENTIDELVRRPAAEFKGPKDPDLWEIIVYMRQARMKGDGKKTKRSETSEKADPELWNIVAKARKIEKKKTYRRF